MANTNNRAKSEASKGSNARGTKGKDTKSASVKPKAAPKSKTTKSTEKAPKTRSKKITTKAPVNESAAIDKVIDKGIDKVAEKQKSDSEIVIAKIDDRKTGTKATDPKDTNRPTTTPDTTAPAVAKVEGDDQSANNIARGPVKDVDVMLLGGKVIDLRPAEPEVKPKSRKKLQWTPARRKYVAEYLADAQIALRLADWEITLQFGVHSDPDGDTLATMTAYEDQRRATMRFGKEFFDLNPNEMRQTLIHEMLHCHMFAPHHNAERTVAAVGGTRAGKAFNVGMTAMVEVATDAIADAMAPFFPTFELPER